MQRLCFISIVERGGFSRWQRKEHLCREGVYELVKLGPVILLDRIGSPIDLLFCLQGD